LSRVNFIFIGMTVMSR